MVVPEDAVGDVIGDLNGRRGRPLGMEPKGSMTEIKAEVPMAEMLNYAPDLRSITGGRGEYTMEFLRYEEVPQHLAQKVISAAGQEEEADGEGVATRPNRGPSAAPRNLKPGFRSQKRFGSTFMKQKVNINPSQSTTSLRRVRSHDAQGRARRALPDAVARAAAGLPAVRAAGAAGGLDPRGGRARDAGPPAATARAPRSASPAAFRGAGGRGGR